MIIYFALLNGSLLFTRPWWWNNPESMDVVRKTLSTCTEEVITLGEVQTFLEESVDVDSVMIPRPFPGDPASLKLAEILDLEVAMKRLVISLST
jgi:hypothetical protein